MCARMMPHIFRGEASFGSGLVPEARIAQHNKLTELVSAVGISVSVIEGIERGDGQRRGAPF
jgi:hypothetical protein